jgi:hypothetical protein
MRLIVFASCTKFCPSAFVGRSPIRLAEKPNVRHAEQIGLWLVGHAGTGHVWTVVSPACICRRRYYRA